MSLVIDLPRSVEDIIEREAQKAGRPPEELVAEVVRKNFASMLDSPEPRKQENESIALLRSWLAEANSARTSDELADAEEDMVELMRGLNAPRSETGQRLHFPEISEQP